ncbi:IATP ATPase inhibitor [Rhizoctonia solani 123E]|uniref:ATPase inhibitor, mitochondrial n=1 Tax=Rhizoctonia solani 123E TaxID=1423351 RepID=A0A074RDQ6_9AGAM|nr:IATP ATPase inhibitor [Rhizoctonia solani 123E]
MIARIALRTAARPTRVVASRATTVRFYSEDQFGRKEKAHEEQYVRKHQEEQLKKLKDQLARSKAEAAQLEQKINEQESKKERK